MAAGLRKRSGPLWLVDVDGVLSLWGFDPNRRPAGFFTSVEGIVHFLSEEPARHLHALRSHDEPAWP